MNKPKFTQEIKDAWLAALKSGNYTQGFTTLVRTNPLRYCCIGVLGEIHPDLDNEASHGKMCPYTFLEHTVGRKLKEEIYMRNDKDHYKEEYIPNYSNVIPLIETLAVQD